MEKGPVGRISSTAHSPKKAAKGYNPMEEYVNQSNFSSRNNPISKSQGVSKDTKSSKKVKNDQRGKKYFKDLNKRYTYNNSPSRTNVGRDSGSKNKQLRPSTVNEKVNLFAGPQEADQSEVLGDSERKRREPIKHTFNEYKSQVSQLQTIEKITPPSAIQLRSPQHCTQPDKTTYFQRKNSSPQPIRIKGLQLKYKVNSSEERQAPEQKAEGVGVPPMQTEQLENLKATQQSQRTGDSGEAKKGNTTDRNKPTPKMSVGPEYGQGEQESASARLRRDRKARSKDQLVDRRPQSSGAASESQKVGI